MNTFIYYHSSIEYEEPVRTKAIAQSAKISVSQKDGIHVPKLIAVLAFNSINAEILESGG